jgi:hypothetical protein
MTPSPEPLTAEEEACERRVHFDGSRALHRDCMTCRFLATLDVARSVTPSPEPLTAGERLVWLIERGQPEGLDHPEWWGVTDSRTGAYGWVDTVWPADQFATRAEAEAVIARFDLPNHPFAARAVEHGFVAANVAVLSEATPDE